PYGLRALSRWHAAHPFQLDLPGFTASVDYQPAESTTGLFGGNSNWRGPLWTPLNYLVVRTLETPRTGYRVCAWPAAARGPRARRLRLGAGLDGSEVATHDRPFHQVHSGQIAAVVRAAPLRV